MIDPRETSTQALAYLGDCVLEMQVREHLVNTGHRMSNSATRNGAAILFLTTLTLVRLPATLSPFLI